MTWFQTHHGLCTNVVGNAIGTDSTSKIIMKRFYGIMGNASKFIADLKLVESSNYGWTEKYISKDGQQWVKFMVDRDNGRYYNLMHFSPRPTTDEMIEIALTSDDHDEVEGAAHRLLFEEEEEMKDFRPRLVERLQSIDLSGLSTTDKKRIRTIILNTHLTDKQNKREVVGKSVKEVQADSDYFTDVGYFAEKLINQIGTV